MYFWRVPVRDHDGELGERAKVALGPSLGATEPGMAGPAVVLSFLTPPRVRPPSFSSFSPTNTIPWPPAPRPPPFLALRRIPRADTSASRTRPFLSSLYSHISPTIVLPLIFAHISIRGLS